MRTVGEYIFQIGTTGTQNAAAELDKTRATLERMSKTGETLSHGLEKLQGFFRVGFAYEFAKGAIESAEALEKMSRTGNVSLEFLQKLKAGARATGGEFETLLSAYQEFARTQANLNAGIGRSGDRLKAFHLLGFSEHDIRSKTAEENIAALTQRMKEGRITAEQYAAGIRLMGESFRELAAAAERGLGDRLAKPGGDPSTTRFLAEAGHTVAQFGSGAKRFGSRTVAGGLTLLDLAVGAGHMLIAPFSSDPESHIKRADELFLEREQVNAGTFGDEESVRERERRLDDKREGLKSARQIASIEAKIRNVMGKDADEVLHELRDRGARREDYEGVLRRAIRQKEKEKEHTEAHAVDLTPKGDKLSQMGLFIGGLAMRSEGHAQTQRLVEIRNELKTLNRKVAKI